MAIKQVPLVLMVAASDPRATDSATYLDFARDPLLINVFESDTEKNTMDRVRKMILDYKLEPEEVIILPNRESAYANTELGVGVSVGGMSIHLGTASGTIKRYPTENMDTLICVWSETTSEISEQIAYYAQCLIQEYNAKDDHHADI